MTHQMTHQMTHSKSEQMTRSKAIVTTIKKRKMNFKLRDMRKRIFMTVTVVFIGSVGFAQDTTTAFGVLRSQTEVDAFDFTTVTGNFVISGTTITNITSLNGLTSIGGILTIQDNPNLTSLEGLEGIENITDLSIAGNDKLTNMSGLDNLTSATLLVIIQDNETLTSLEGLEKLTTIGSIGLSIYNNAKISTLNGLENLTSLGGILRIGTSDGFSSDPNPALTNFCAISQLVTGVSPQITTSEYFVISNAYNPTYAQLGNMVTCEGITQDGDFMITTQDGIDMVAGNIIAITGNVKIKEAMAGTITSSSFAPKQIYVTG